MYREQIAFRIVYDFGILWNQFLPSTETSIKMDNKLNFLMSPKELDII